MTTTIKYHFSYTVNRTASSNKEFMVIVVVIYSNVTLHVNQSRHNIFVCVGTTEMYLDK